MAEAKKGIAKGLQGQLGKQLVFKQYQNKTIVTKYPDMSGVTPSPQQRKARKRFAAAVAHARAINNDPAQKAAYQAKIPKGASVYQYALQEYLKLGDL
jgi:hypothetical protein